jgi:hypothetical protein
MDDVVHEVDAGRSPSKLRIFNKPRPYNDCYTSLAELIDATVGCESELVTL